MDESGSGLRYNYYLTEKLGEVELSIYQVWSEGYEASGNAAHAELHGEVDAEDFSSACEALFKDSNRLQYFDRQRLTYWGCRLFDNEEDARKAFG